MSYWFNVSAMVLAFVVIVLLLLSIRQESKWEAEKCLRERSEDSDRHFVQTHLTDKDSSANSATSGRLWAGTQTNSFPRDKLLYSNTYIDSTKTALLHDKANVTKGQFDCEYWSVVSTIFEPADAIILQSQLEGWCTVIVGDVKSPPEYKIPHSTNNNWVFLDVAAQKKMAFHYPLIELLPWSHFGRKNVGFLFALLNGAKVVWDFDDDNILETPTKRMDIPKVSSLTGSIKVNDLMHRRLTKAISFDVYVPENVNDIAFNPYPLMGAPNTSCWPRGFPLDLIKSQKDIKLSKRSYSMADVGIIQSLANHDPDIDAIYRLTQKDLPFSFIDSRAKTKGYPLAVPLGKYSPYNAQATLHFYSALWSLYLPVTVHGRVSDIWRGYIFQRLAADCKISLLFSAPMVSQYRNAHNYLADFDSEDHLYKRSGKLLEQITAWKPDSKTLPGMLEELYIFLYEHGYLNIKDVELIQWWIKELIIIGYEFPDKCSVN